MTNENKNPVSEIYGRCRDAIDLALSGKSKRERLLMPTLASFFGVLAFLLTSGNLPVSTVGAPLSDALLCSAGAYTPFVYVGCVLGSVYFGKMSIARMLALTFIFVLRIITSSRSIGAGVSDKIFSERITCKLAVSAAMCFVQCGMFLAVGGLDASTAKSVLYTLIITPFISLVFSIYYAKKGESGWQRLLYELSMLSIFAVSVLCAGEIRFAFLKIDVLLAVFFTLCIAKYGGFTRGLIYGALLGYVASPSYFIGFALLGGACALIFSFGAYSACGIACAISSVYFIIVGGATALATVVSETVMACAITSPVLRYSFLPSGFPFPTSEVLYAESFSENARYLIEEISFITATQNAAKNLMAVNEKINEVASSFNKSEADTEKIADSVCSLLCEKCPMSPVCLDTNGKITRDALLDLAKRKANKNTSESIPPYLLAQCIRLRELNEICANLVTREGSKEFPPTPLPSLDYTAVASIISSLGGKAENELVFDKISEKKIASLLYTCGISFAGISVVGSKRKKVCLYGADIVKVKKVLDKIQKGLKDIFGFAYGEPSSKNVPFAPITFMPTRALKTEIALASSSKDGEDFCGDTVITFDDSADNFYALISDGMGSGKAAGKSSAITAELIKHLTLSGIDTDLAVHLAGQTLTRLCDECFSTVDLMKLDLVSGQTSVIKNHAAASYVLRNGSVYCCSASSMPIGIDSDTPSEQLSFNLQEGDTVIMVSDGIADGLDDKMRLPDLIGIEGALDSDALASRIISRAKEIKGKNDDMSALVIKIKSA